MHSANVDVDVKNCGRRQIKPQLKTRCLRSLWRQLMIALYIPTSPLSSRFANCSLIDLAAWRIIYCCTGGSDKERFVLFGSWANIAPDWIPCQPLLPLHRRPWIDFAKNSNNKESGIRNLTPQNSFSLFQKTARRDVTGKNKVAIYGQGSCLQSTAGFIASAIIAIYQALPFFLSTLVPDCASFFGQSMSLWFSDLKICGNY